MFDIETLGVESTTVILSAAIIHFNPEDKPSYDDLLNKALCVKFDSRDQVTRLKRTVDKNTIKWWGEQSEYVRNLALPLRKVLNSYLSTLISIRVETKRCGLGVR